MLQSFRLKPMGAFSLFTQVLPGSNTLLVPVMQLRLLGSTILGVVLNKIPESSLEYEYGYRYGYPRYYGANYRPYAKRRSEAGQYAPSADVLSRQELEDHFYQIKGQRFKEELKRDDLTKA